MRFSCPWFRRNIGALFALAGHFNSTAIQFNQSFKTSCVNICFMSLDFFNYIITFCLRFLRLVWDSSKEGKCHHCMLLCQYCICDSIEQIRSEKDPSLTLRFVVWMHHKVFRFFLRDPGGKKFGEFKDVNKTCFKPCRWDMYGYVTISIGANSFLFDSIWMYVCMHFCDMCSLVAEIVTPKIYRNTYNIATIWRSFGDVPHHFYPSAEHSPGTKTGIQHWKTLKAFDATSNRYWVVLWNICYFHPKP